MKIGIDLDSTIAKIDTVWLGRLKRACGTNYTPNDWTDWELSFLTKEERAKFFALFTPNIYEEVEPYPHAAEAIEKLSRICGAKLVCVTTNPSKDGTAFSEAKRKWLTKNVPSLASSVIFSKTKFGLGLDVLVDDAPQHFGLVDYIPVLVERPWNTRVNCSRRFSDWREGERMLLSLICRENNMMV